MAFDGVPNETRKSLPNGTTLFERVLPGPDRMYPDTDSAPFPIEDAEIEEIRKGLPREVKFRQEQLANWTVPPDTHRYLLSHNLVPLMEKLIDDLGYEPRFVGSILGHTLKNIEGTIALSPGFDYIILVDLFRFVSERGLDRDIIQAMLPVVYVYPNMVLDSVLIAIEYGNHSLEEILADVPSIVEKFREIGRSNEPRCAVNWIMGCLRPRALGNVPLRDLRSRIEKEVGHV